jgi:hypothetical protein
MTSTVASSGGTEEYVGIMPTRVVQRDDAVDRLAEIVTMRRQLCDEHVAVENQAAHLDDAMLSGVAAEARRARPAVNEHIAADRPTVFARVCKAAAGLSNAVRALE